MEPKLPAPNFQPEQRPVSYEPNPERTFGAIPETAVEKSVEQQAERQGETSTKQIARPTLPSPVSAPPVPTSSAQSAMPLTGDDAPLAAADEDLIEKEWVDKAKKIVEETRDDPYRREQEVGKLQADYLRKRYGKELGVS